MAGSDGTLPLGSPVELFGLPEVLEVSDLLGTADRSQLAPFKPNGKRGKVLHYTQGHYTVETFDAVILSVPRENLRLFVPETPLNGGFHLFWPVEAEEATAEFAAVATEMLMREGYCVIQMSMSDSARQHALQEAEHMRYKRMRREFEPAYLGRQYKCKTAWLDSIVQSKDKVLSVLDACDLQLSDFTSFMLPLAPSALDFFPYSRTNAMVRIPFQSTAEEGQFRAEAVNEDDIEDGLVDSHIEFIKRRHICMMYIVETSGGELTLVPKDETQDNVVLEIEKCRLIVFLHNKMSYIYNPFDSTDLVLQSWILHEPEQLKFVSLAGDQSSKDEALGVHVGPNTPDGFRTNVFGIAVGFPASSHGSEDNFWSAVASGADGVVYTPITRFDMDIYCRPADQWWPGISYTGHGGFVSEDIYALDNKLFGITEEEAYIMAPAQRVVLEKGYEALYRSNYRKGPGLRGRKIGVFVGHSGDDWSFSQVFTCGKEDRYRLGHQSRIWGTLAGRMSYILGLKGPQALIDTACSSALVAYGVGHSMLRHKEPNQVGYSIDNRLEEALMVGCNLMPGPGGYLSLCGPHMLSVKGRCFTFDHSADGFCRGEGTGAFLVRNEEVMSPEAFATVIGACLNQDGRSASMTAPNGPAQQECIRGSMREAGLSANQVTCAECHGTGTALGDPIEVGALRGVMQDRVLPILQTSAKAHIGHLEAGAGNAGIIKCMLMCVAAAGSPNCHFKELNPHLDVNGYPTLFATELTDYGYNSGYSGVSSFGFGGANSRADVFASAKKGPHSTGTLDWNKVDYVTVTCPFDGGPMHYTDGRCVPRATSKRYKHEAYRADAIRDEFASYDMNSSLYTGKFHLAPRDVDEFDEAPKDPIFIIGSWDQFRDAYEMDVGHHDTWTFLITLGETRCERFQLRVNNNAFEAIYPFVKDGSMRTRCAGPDDEGDGHYWLLDGRDAQVSAGTVYRVTFAWGTPGTMSWEVVDVPPPIWAKSCKHTYSIAGSWTGGVFESLHNVSKNESENLWEGKLRIGMSGMEWFYFARDNDLSQRIYPAKTGCSEDVPVCGPDDMCNDKNWRVGGKTGEIVTLRLQIVDAHVTLMILSNSMGTRIMQSVEGPRRHSYHIAGSFSGWTFEEMSFDPETLSTFRYRGTLGESCEEYFYISADADCGLTFFPEAEAAYPGDSIVAGPDSVADGRVFHIFGLKVGAEFEIAFDRNAADKRKVVDIKWVTSRVDTQSMKLAFYNFFNTTGPPDMLLDRADTPFW